MLSFSNYVVGVGYTDQRLNVQQRILDIYLAELEWISQGKPLNNGETPCFAALVIPDPRNVNHEFPALALSALLGFYRDAACHPSTGMRRTLVTSEIFNCQVKFSSESALLFKLHPLP